MSSPDDRPLPPPVPPHDPLLEDPVFAEIVAPKPPSSRVAEPVEDSTADLPVAEVVLPEPVKPPEPPRPESLPKAFPVSPRPTKEPPASWPANRSSFPTLPSPPDSSTPSKSPWFAACSVIGCLGVFVIAAIAILAWIAITLLNQFGDRLKEGKKKGETEIHTSGTRPAPVHLKPLTHDIALRLPGQADAVRFGGGGRFVLLRIPAAKEIAVFDVNELRIVHHLPIGEEKALFAAGAAKIFIYKPHAASLQRFDLTTWQREAEVPFRPTETIDALAIGGGSDGPLYAISASTAKAGKVNLFNGESLEWQTTHIFPGWIGRGDQQLHARASRDGTLLGVATAKEAFAIRFDSGEEPRAIPLTPNVGAAPHLATPSPDGQFLYTSRGVFDPAGKQVLGAGREPFFTFPTVHGSGLFLSLEVENRRVGGFPQLHAAGTEFINPLATLNKGDLSGDLPVSEVRQISPDERVWLWPGGEPIHAKRGEKRPHTGGILGVLPIANNEIQLFAVDVAESLEGSARSFLAFATEPPTSVHRGGTWAYTPRFWSSENAEPNLQVAGDIQAAMQMGTLIWGVPANAPDSVEVIITARLKGLHAEQKFRIKVMD